MGRAGHVSLQETCGGAEARFEMTSIQSREQAGRTNAAPVKSKKELGPPRFTKEAGWSEDLSSFLYKE